jgi:hypothetical protein
MSNRYKGGVISATPPTTTGGEDGVASGAWTLEQQMQLQAAGLWPAQPTGPYIEQVFSTYLYTGNGGTQTITNGINLSGKGGLVWVKERSPNTADNNLVDTVRGVTSLLFSNLTNAAQIGGSPLNSFGSTGFVTNANGNSTNSLYATWTFREQPKFFDVVTWTGSNDSGTSIGQGIVPHNLGSAPGCVIIKNVTQGATNWIVYHRSLSGGYRLLLNTTDAQTNSGSVSYFSKYVGGVGWTQTNPDATNIYVGYNYQTNGNADTMVAYLFAHDAGGFGLTGTDNVISCGSFTTDGSGTATVNFGFEPQWVMRKTSSSAASGWEIIDNMRGMLASPGESPFVRADSSLPETSLGVRGQFPNATGFSVTGSPSTDYIYIAIRRGPMRTPTVGTSVFTPTLATFSGTTVTNTGYVVDMVITKSGVATTSNNFVIDRLRGSDNGANQNTLPSTSSTSAEVATSGRVAFTGTKTIQNGFLQQETTANNIVWAFGRAPSFFDEVCYTGNSTGSRAISHNLGVIPELIIVKSRSAVRNWPVYIGSQGNNGNSYLNLSNAWAGGSDMFANTTPTASEFYVGNNALTNNTAETYVAYLFATCAGVSKVGSYTGTGAAQTINCGFTAGSRFVLIKRTDSTGGWHVWDSARGIIPTNDPYLLLNSTAAETTGTDYVDTTNVGFDITSTAPDAINASGGTFIFLAIA